MKWPFEKFAIALVIIVLSVIGSRLHAQQPVANSPAPGLLSIIHSARQQLQAEIDRESKDFKRDPVIVTSRDVRLRVKLALWSEQDGSITVVRITKGAGKVVAVEHPSYAISIKRDNGVNSEYVVRGHPELHVLAVKHPIFVDISTAKQPRWRLDNVVYTPYSDFLRTTEIIVAGEAYLEAQINSALSRLRTKGIYSRAYPAQFLADAIDPLVVKSIIAIEHVSPAALVTGNVGDYFSSFATVLGTNERASYAYARSSASARGLAQFIPSTYRRLRTARPELGLFANFEQGMSDSVNAITAEIALIDMNLTYLPTTARERYHSSPRDIGALLAAMYNGGSTRPRRAVQLWGDLWWRDHSVEIQQAQAEEKAAKAEIIRLQKLAIKKGATAAERSAYEQDIVLQRQRQSAAIASSTAGTRANLRRETILYVAKFYLLYDQLSAALAPSVPAVTEDTSALGGDETVQIRQNMVP